MIYLFFCKFTDYNMASYLMKEQTSICFYFLYAYDPNFHSEIAKHLSLPPVKLHCSMLAEDAIKAAVKDYEAKKAKQAGNVEAAAAQVEKAANA